jgi:hypothetical protein
MKKLLALAMVAALGIAGCETTGGSQGPPSGPPSPSVTGDKAMIAVKSAEAALNLSAEAAVNAGLLVPGSLEAVHVADLLAQLHSAIAVADLTQAQTLIDLLVSTIPKKGA